MIYRTMLAIAAVAMLATACKKGQSLTCADKIRNLKGDASKVGASFNVSCPASCKNTVYGSEKYTTDSSICTAAVHAGVIKADKGGSATVTIVKSNPKYEGTEANGVTTRSWSSSWGATAFQVK